MVLPTGDDPLDALGDVAPLAPRPAAPPPAARPPAHAPPVRDGAHAPTTDDVAPSAPERPLSPTRILANYLTALRLVVNEATESRRAWIRQIGTLMQDTRTRPLGMVTPQAGRIGSEQQKAFQEIRGRLDALQPPSTAVDLHTLLHTWLDKHITVCQVLVEFGANGEIGKLRTAQGLLAEGRVDLERFQAEYARQVQLLKRQVESVRRNRRKVRWPFGRPRA